ncbi:MAG: hypothetical protein K0S47_1583 [Herbinix sp.]|jgi:hypothetical protein|nr:hypothetical protein [Herbinix sp.]
MPKETRLNDEADIYQPRIEQSEKQKLKEMSFREKRAYLWEYYKIHFIASVAGIAFLIYVIHTIITPNVDTVFYAAMINNPLPDDVLEQVEAEFSDVLQLDPETQEVYLNSSFFFNQTGDYTMNMKQALTTYIASSEVDVIIAPESEFKSYAYYGYLVELSDAMPTDLYSNLTDSFFSSEMEDTKENGVYGVYLTNTKLYQNSTTPSDPYVLGIVANSKHSENAIEYIRYLFK